MPRWDAGTVNDEDIVRWTQARGLLLGVRRLGRGITTDIDAFDVLANATS